MSVKNWKDKIGKNRIYSQDHAGREDVVLWDVLRIENEQWIKVEFISKNSPYLQGVRLAIDVGEGYLDSGGEFAKDMRFWENTAPKKFYVKCVSTEGLLSVYNIWNKRNMAESQMYGSGMLIEQDGNKTIYRCHDVSMENVSFDKIVFSIEKISSKG